ncbi:MAG TPA: type II toxin-antitoxin system PemK/MazF family toxin [Candidatus Merdiplasma excrementigallinarum]|uniref:Type II toxin-antitoxin system PemK/MazF family toxin n=1 Tax=Candidatus Merdiplasma excrementigallinarum TaxID=2840864 RepID=A0A9D1NZ02_9FIRM|nr:type II toxin-antitoxin system PemK/MazF family toxin [Candidatus Merdiplasma excrementigallinarum]
MKNYLKSQIKTNEAIMSEIFNPDEIDRFSKSDIRWADNRKKSFQNRTVKKGEIYQFEFGKNYIPEMSYEHRGLVIGVKKKLIYVLPIFSYDPDKYPDIYHSVDSPKSKSDLFLLKCKDFPFITHDSVLKLNDIRTLSINRILYQQNGRILPSSDTYKQIETLVLQKYFSNFYFEFEKNNQEIMSLRNQIEILKNENKSLKFELDNIKINPTEK